jgi:hypothetical protein
LIFSHRIDPGGAQPIRRPARAFLHALSLLTFTSIYVLSWNDFGILNLDNPEEDRGGRRRFQEDAHLHRRYVFQLCSPHCVVFPIQAGSLTEYRPLARRDGLQRQAQHRQAPRQLHYIPVPLQRGPARGRPRRQGSPRHLPGNRREGLPRSRGAPLSLYIFTSTLNQNVVQSCNLNPPQEKLRVGNMDFSLVYI